SPFNSAPGLLRNHCRRASVASVPTLKRLRVPRLKQPVSQLRRLGSTATSVPSAGPTTRALQIPRVCGEFRVIFHVFSAAVGLWLQLGCHPMRTPWGRSLAPIWGRVPRTGPPQNALSVGGGSTLYAARELLLPSRASRTAQKETHESHQPTHPPHRTQRSRAEQCLERR